MSLFDQINGQISQPQQSGTEASPSGLAGSLTSLLGSEGESGALASLVDRFRAPGRIVSAGVCPFTKITSGSRSVEPKMPDATPFLCQAGLAMAAASPMPYHLNVLFRSAWVGSAIVAQ